MKDLKQRLRTWAAEEKIKLSGISGAKEKTAYIWEYYKIWIICIIFFVWFAGFAVHQFATKRADYRCYIIFNNTYADVGTDSELWFDYVRYAGFGTGDGDIEFNALSYFDYLKGVTGNSYFEAFVTYADGGILDGFVTGTESLRALGKTGRLIDLNSGECISIKEKYGDRFIYAVPFDEDYEGKEVPVGIDISDSRLVTEYKAYSEPVSLGIGAMSDNIDAVEMFLDFILQDQEAA